MECLNVLKHQSLVKLCCSFMVCASFTTLAGCSNRQSMKNLPNSSLDFSNAPLEVTILDTGKSDCILIEIEDKTVMIDTGFDKTGEKILDALHNKGITDIDYLILTHMDKDHIGGADIILDSIPVNHVIQADYSKDSTQYVEYVESLNRHNITPTLLHENLEITLNDAKLTLYPAKKTEYEASNNYSIITSLVYGKDNFLFAGDAESERLSEFLNDHPTTYTFLKLPHHGKDNEMISTFLNTIKPEYAVITCSEDEMPDQKVISTLNHLGTQTLLTSDGSVIIKCDGDGLSVTQQLTQYITFESE